MLSYLLSTSGLYTLKFSGQIMSFKLDFKNSKWKSKWHFGNFRITWFRVKNLNFSFGKIFKLLFIWRFISKWSDSTAPMILTNILRPQKHFTQTPVQTSCIAQTIRRTLAVRRTQACPYIPLNVVLVKFLIDHESWSNWAIFTWKWPYIELLIVFGRFSLIFTFAELIVDKSPLTWISKNWFE